MANDLALAPGQFNNVAPVVNPPTPPPKTATFGDKNQYTYNVDAKGTPYGAPISPAIINSNAATKDLTKIKGDVTDINTGIQTQAQKIAADKATADAAAGEKSKADAAAKVEADKAAAAKAAAEAKTAALNGGATTLPTDPTFQGQLNHDPASIKSVVTNPDGTRTVYFNTGGTQTIDKDPNAPATIIDSQAADNELSQQRLADAQKTFDQITGIQNGTIPLNPGEQAQIDGLKQQFQQLIDQQQQVNKGATGIAQTRGYQSGAAEYDPAFQAKTIGSIITAGANKISDLNVKMASAVASLTQSFKDNDIAAIKSAYTILDDARKDRQTTIEKTITDAQKVIKDAADAKAKVQENIDKVISDLKAAGAPKDVVASAASATTVADALQAGGDYLQTSTNPDIAKYLQYKKDALSQGLVPTDYQEFQDQQDAKAAKQKFTDAYNTQAGKNAADAANGGGGGYNGTTQKQQIALEQQYRGILAKEFSARTGALGVENAKVNQANHLDSLIKQYYDPKTGNYNIPVAQYNELALGLANLISPTGTASDSLREEINKATAAGDIKSALQYITGTLQTGNTQAMIKNAVDSIDRQAVTATANRQAALDNMKDLAPTDLDPARVSALNQSTQMVQYSGQDRVSKDNINKFLSTNGNNKVQLSDGEHSLWYVAQTLADTPGSTPKDVEDYFKAQGWIQ